ncbi:lasso peptide biosynthesis B2 protein [Parvularcula flava]|uniref:Lasso peptide biosynthesis B2 protein n=1 Tax=Aquisalinus luteolus TaxID=1566827 RepID=A0ABX0HGD2_9PROT|nr:lasso peptide biosynthesis B2 protein [Aquisalinus luteolus]NHK27170.1 lasso peptide biosynthesis B2 protein [Aquisalinus luteolus]
MHHILRDQLAFCFCDNHAVFLDERHDRYFQLSAKLSKAFRQFTDTGACDPDSTDTLVERGIIVEGDWGATPLTPASIDVPKRSVIESPERGATKGCSLLGVAVTMHRCRRKVASLPLSKLLNARRKARARLLTEPEKAIALAARFNRLRRRLPFSPECLPDSLALLAILDGQSIAADLVIGIKLNPFEAHCWVQSADCLLNEAVDHARTFTPVQTL